MLCPHCGQDHRRIITTFIGDHQYTIVFEDGDEGMVAQVLEGWANDPELNFPHKAAASLIVELLDEPTGNDHTL